MCDRVKEPSAADWDGEDLKARQDKFSESQQVLTESGCYHESQALSKCLATSTDGFRACQEQTKALKACMAQKP